MSVIKPTFSQKIDIDSLLSYIDDETLKELQIDIDKKDIRDVWEILSEFKWLSPDQFQERIKQKNDGWSYMGKEEKIYKFIKLFEYLEDNYPENKFKLWLSENFPFFWKEVLANIF